MCSPTGMLMGGQAVAGAITGIGVANIKAADAKSRGAFEAAQMENLSILAGARAMRQQRDINIQFAQQLQNNIAAGVMSGLDLSSFTSIEKGRRKDKRFALRDIGSNLSVERSNYKLQAAAAKLGGDMEAAAARLNGTTAALTGLMNTAVDFSRGYTGNSAYLNRIGWNR